MKKTTRKKITKKITKLNKKSHTIGCKDCGRPTVCASEAEWVLCWECVSKMSYIQVKKVSNPRKKKTIKKKK